MHILVARITSISNSISKEFMVIKALDGRELPLFYVQVFDESRDLEFMVEEYGLESLHLVIEASLVENKTKFCICV